MVEVSQKWFTIAQMEVADFSFLTTTLQVRGSKRVEFESFEN